MSKKFKNGIIHEKNIVKMKGRTLLMIFLVFKIRLVFDFKMPSSAQNCNEVKQS